MLPLPPRQNAWTVRAENRPRCRLPQTGVRGIATRPSVGEIASDVLAPEVKSQRRRQTLLEMTSARSGLEIEFKRDGQSAIFAWTKRTSSVKWAVSALPSGAHPGNLRRKLMRKVPLSLAIALLFAGSAALTADAQTSSGAGCCAELHADRTGGVPGMGTLLSAWICPRVRPVPMLVSSLLVTDMRTARPH